jgi:hypothetical protein
VHGRVSFQKVSERFGCGQLSIGSVLALSTSIPYGVTT